jgi:plasmid stabilization system protein ParE
MSFSLRILPRAEKDAQHIFDYIADRSPEGALRWWDALQQAARKITENPERYGYALENSFSHFDLHQFLFKTLRGRTYRGIFVVVDGQIRVLRIRGPGQAPLDESEMPLE